jgi:hypothetical protein
MLVALVWVKLARSGALTVGRSFDDEGVGGGRESVDRRLGQQGVGRHGQPLEGSLFEVTMVVLARWRSTMIS